MTKKLIKFNNRINISRKNVKSGAVKCRGINKKKWRC